MVTCGFPKRMSREHGVTDWFGLEWTLKPMGRKPGWTRLQVREVLGWDNFVSWAISKSLLSGFCTGNIPDLGLILSGSVLLFGADLSQTVADLNLPCPGGCFELGDERMLWELWVRVMGFAPRAAPQNCSTGKAEQPHPVLPHLLDTLKCQPHHPEACPHPHLLVKLWQH